MDENVNQQLPAIYDDALIEASQNAEKRIEAVKKIKVMSLRVTNPQDWVDEGGKPYPQASGSEKIARLFGISWRIDQPLYVVEEDGHYRYEYKGYFSLGNVEIEVIGVRSSRDPFFAGSKDYPKPISEINKGNVQKSALTNCIANGVTRLLGLRNLTWEDLEEAGINKDSVNRVDFKKKEMSSDGKKLRDEIESMLMEMCGDDKAKFAAALQKVTSFTGQDGKEIRGKSKLEDISEKAIPVNHEKVKKAYEEWKKGHDGQSNNQK